MADFFEGASEAEELIRVEEQREGDDWVVRFELPGVDPDRDVELTVLDGVLHIPAPKDEKSEATRIPIDAAVAPEAAGAHRRGSGVASG